MRGIRKWTGMLLAVLLGVSAPAGPGFAEPADVRVLEDGAPFLAADFENGSPGDWQLESGAPVRTVTVAASDQLSITSMENDALRRKLESISVETLTPIEAMNALYELKQML